MIFATARAQYAALAVFELARAYRAKKTVSTQKIATKYRISNRFLAQIMRDLKLAGLVATERGALGGFRLIPAPEELTLGYVVALVDKTDVASASEAPPESSTDAKKTPGRTASDAAVPKSAPLSAEAAAARNRLDATWREADARRQEYLNDILFSDLIDDSRDKQNFNFSI